MINFEKSTVHELQTEQTRIQSALSECEDIAAQFRNELQLLKAEIARRVKPAIEPRVSDHAMMRYMERVMGLDIEKIRADILTDNAKAALKLGCSSYSVNSVKFKAKDGVFITVI